MNSIRLNRYLASAGVASRRAAEELILAGRVAVNGTVAILTTPVMPEDQVTLDGEPVKPESEKVYYLLNKPRGYVCSTKGEPKVLDLFSDVEYRLFTVGRLDKETEGLLLVTNDGSFADEVIHPSKNVEKEYIVKADQEIDDTHLKAISAGTLVEGVQVAPIRVTKIRNGTMRIVIGEGKKREVRHLLEAAGLQTLALKRVRVGSLILGNIDVGTYRPLTEAEKERLLAGSNESEEIPSESLEFQGEEDHVISGMAEKQPPAFEERRPDREKSFSPRADRGRGFGDRGPDRRDSRPFQRGREGERPRFDGERRRESTPENRAPYPRRDSFQRDQDRPREFSRAPRPYGDRPSRPFGDRPNRDERPREFSRAPRPYGDRPSRPFGDRPNRDERPREFSRAPRPYGDRPPRPSFSNDRRESGFSERAPREGQREGGFSRDASFGDRRRDFSDRPQRDNRFSDRGPPRERREWTPRPPFARDGGRGFGGEERKPFAPRDRESRFQRDGESRGPREWSREKKVPFGRDRGSFQKEPFQKREDA